MTSCEDCKRIRAKLLEDARRTTTQCAKCGEIWALVPADHKYGVEWKEGNQK